MDPEFTAIPEEFTGLLGWRIVDFKLEKVQDIGAFYTGDSYLYFHAYIKGTSKRIIRDIFFWLGSESTTDEKGTAAMKAVDLDDRFGGAPIQHREVQNHESDKFLDLFEEHGGLRYLNGGAASGFKQVTKDNHVDLYRIKGRKQVVVEVMEPKRGNLNHGDVFILHAPGKFFVWIGNKANTFEKMKSERALESLKKSEPKAEVIRIEDEPNAEFDKIIGNDSEIGAAQDDDVAFEKSFIKAIYDSTGKMIVKDAAVQKSALPKDGVAFVRNGNKIFAYVAKKAPKDAKKHAIKQAMDLLTKFEMPDWAPIEVIYEGVDDDDFELVFQ